MPRQFYFCKSKNEPTKIERKMNSVVVTAPELAPVGGCENLTVLSILQSMNELRKQDFFTDIHVEVRLALLVVWQ